MARVRLARSQSVVPALAPGITGWVRAAVVGGVLTVAGRVSREDGEVFPNAHTDIATLPPEYRFPESAAYVARGHLEAASQVAYVWSHAGNGRLTVRSPLQDLSVTFSISIPMP